MGRFIHDSSLTLMLEDEVLGHLQAVIGAKFRLQQSFYLSWDYPGTGGSRTTIWLTPGTSLQFLYRTARPAPLDRDRINALFAQANSPDGLVIHLDH